MKKLCCIFLLLNTYNFILQSSENPSLTDQRKKELHNIVATFTEPLSTDCQAMADRLDEKFDENHRGYEKVMTALKSLKEQQKRHLEEINASLDNLEKQAYRSAEEIKADLTK